MSSSEQERESFLSKIATEVLDAAEKLTNRFEEGLSLIFDASAAGDKNNPHKTTGDASSRETLTREQLETTLHGEFSEEELRMMEDDDMPSSPLEGMAESVLGDIMANQVRRQQIIYLSVMCVIFIDLHVIAPYCGWIISNSFFYMFHMCCRLVHRVPWSIFMPFVMPFLGTNHLFSA
jgi:hypothetical protein